MDFLFSRLIRLLALVLAGVFVFNYGAAGIRTLRQSWRKRSRRPMLQPNQNPQTTTEPALRQYFFGQAFVDYRAILSASLRTNARIVRSDYIYGLGCWLLTGRGPNGRWVSFEGWSRLLGLVAGLLFSYVMLVALALACLAYLGLGILNLGVIAAIAFVCVVLAGVLRILDAVRLSIRKIRITCPHPGCYERISLPVYECRNESCRRRHRKLVPGVYGVFRRRCICGSSLPTLLMLGRYEIIAFCPVCDRPLPDRSGSARAVHLPVIGGPSAGKTMLIMSVVMTLERLAEQSVITLSFATKSDLREYQRAKQRLVHGGDLEKTPVHLPRAFMIYLGRPRGPSRLVYLYDPAGEYYQSSEMLQQQLYLRHAAGLLFALDPFSVPWYMAGLESRDQHLGKAARPSSEDPESAYHRLTGSLRGMANELGRKRLAVVVTKTDVLEQLRASTPLPTAGESDEIRTWVQSILLGNLVRSMEHHFGEVCYFWSSARRAVSASASRVDPVIEPVLWLLEQSGLDLRPFVRTLAQ